ncbi:Rud3p LALA0_S10e01750g [Lachancea lanzarotensis]|uniref:LALA0S10e01750g1_1 n=1 Tax=Lachancea lanzarotensis TaxID=1245769 RepID=A0A0C7NCK8_9SACH|nr:uncharacterized protein LALA0_S10e01750g [Lachancea lanzarotensis]CEP64077.1 LALA0S10e01750g1_1 [Lachancea lanzarotensis]
MAKSKKKANKTAGTTNKSLEPQPTENEPIADSNAMQDGLSANIKDTFESASTPLNTDGNKELNEEIARLQAEVAELKLKAQLQPETKNEDEDLSAKLAQVQEERDRFEHQYDSLLDRLSSMKAVFSKMRESQEELESCQDQLREYESQNLSLKDKLDSAQRQSEELRNLTGTLNQELSGLDEENEKLTRNCSEAENANVLLKEDIKRLKREHENKQGQLANKVQELELVLSNFKQDAGSTKEELEDTVQRLQKTESAKSKIEKELTSLKVQLEEGQAEYLKKDATKDKLIEELTNKLEGTQSSLKETQEILESSKSAVDTMAADVSQKEALQQECKEKALQIGKLRHEAIILNEHLTKALALLKRSNDSESVDKELISNLLISFVAIPRADPKKFEVLELISSFLNWDDDKKQQAGLILSANGIRSTSSGSRTQNFVSLWTEFLEKESEK